MAVVWGETGCDAGQAEASWRKRFLAKLSSDFMGCCDVTRVPCQAREGIIGMHGLHPSKRSRASMPHRHSNARRQPDSSLAAPRNRLCKCSCTYVCVCWCVCVLDLL